MGIHTAGFRCPYCERIIGQGAAGPNFTNVGSLDVGPAPQLVVVLSCPECKKVIGAYSTPSE